MVVFHQCGQVWKTLWIMWKTLRGNAPPLAYRFFTLHTRLYMPCQKILWSHIFCQVVKKIDWFLGKSALAPGWRA